VVYLKPKQLIIDCARRFVLTYTDTKHRAASLRQQSFLYNFIFLTLGGAHVAQSMFSESNSRRICHSTSTSTLLVLSAFFNYDNYAASDVLWMTTLSLHSFMRSSWAEWIIAAVSWLALRGSRPTSCNVSSTRQHESSRTRASSTGDSFIYGEVSYTGWMLSTGFGSEFASRCRCLHTMAPEYLSTYWQPVSGISGRRHLHAIGWPWSSRLPTCETCFVRRTFTCIRQPFLLTCSGGLWRHFYSDSETTAHCELLNCAA